MKNIDSFSMPKLDLYLGYCSYTNPHKEVTTQKAPAIFAQGVTMQ